MLDLVKVKGKKNAVELIELLSEPMPSEVLRVFAEARVDYAAQRWKSAITKFQEANRQFQAVRGQGDAPCELFVARCLAFEKAPPEKDWDGSWEMHSK